MTEHEERLLIALAGMVEQYPESTEDVVDSLSMSAGEHAIEALADFGLMEIVSTPGATDTATDCIDFRLARSIDPTKTWE